MTKQEAQQKFNEELIKELKATPFPNEQFYAATNDILSMSDYTKIKYKVLDAFSLSELQSQFPISIEEYATLVRRYNDFTLFEVQLINALLMISKPTVLGGADDYAVDLEMALAVGKVYNQAVQPISEAIKTRIEIMGVQGPWGQPLKLVN